MLVLQGSVGKVEDLVNEGADDSVKGVSNKGEFEIGRVFEDVAELLVG